MNDKFTPGPWQVNKKYKMSVETCADGQGINLIAECSDPDGIRTAGEDRANAALIAAAPDLLAALEYWFDSKATSAEIAKRARSAINKARGIE